MWWAIIILLVLLIGWGLLRRRDRSRREAIVSRQRMDRIDTESQRNTIRVVLVCMPGEEHECALTLYSLFADAEHPWRVTVRLAYPMAALDDLTTVGPLDLYAQRCERETTPSFTSNIYQADMADPSAGAAVARRALLREAGRERHLMSLGVGAKMVQGWDSKAVRMWKTVSRNVPRPCITAHPSLSTYTGFADTTLATFSAIEVVNQLPQPRPIPFSAKPSRCFPTPIYCAKFAFGDRSLGQTLGNALPLECAADAESLVCTHRLVCGGWNLVSPTVPIVEYVQGEADSAPIDHQHADYHRRQATLGRVRAEKPDVHARALEDVVKHTGVGRDGKVAPHARAGCTANPSAEEKVAKFGEDSVYQALIAAWAE